MNYLIQQMWLCLSLAALLGALIGWWLAKTSYQNKLKQREAEWQNQLNRKSKEASVDIESVDSFAIPTATTVATTDVDEVAQEDTVEKATNLDPTSYDVEEVEGIGPNYGQKLRDMGIHSTEQLLGQAYNMDGQMQIAEQIGIEDFVIRKWASMCDLMRLAGVNSQISERMVNAGMDSVQDLGQQNAAGLLTKLSSTGSAQEEMLPDEATLAQIINQAQSLKTVMRDD